MKIGDAKDIAIIGLVLAAVYLMWKYANKVADDVAAPIADAIIGATLPGSVVVLGQVKLPDGRTIPMNGLVVDNRNQFTSGGKRYQLVSRDGNIYTARAA